MISRRETLAMLAAGAAATAAKPAWARDVGGTFYDNALVIDALSFMRDWDEPELAALAATGYSGFIESLSRRDLQTAIDALMTYRKRVAEHCLPMTLSARKMAGASQR